MLSYLIKFFQVQNQIDKTVKKISFCKMDEQLWCIALSIKMPLEASINIMVL